MKVTIEKTDVAGRVAVPSSKSQTIRGLMCAALAKGESEIANPLVCDDTEAAAEVLQKIGVHIKREKDLWRVTGGTFHTPDTDLFCRDSATTLRFMTAVCALVPGTCRLVGGPSLSRRPVRSLVEALQKLKVNCTMEGKTTPPVVVVGGTLRGGPTDLPGNISSQFISALLLIAPFAEKAVSIKLTTKLTSRPYLLMTIRCMRHFGINVTSGHDNFLVPKQTYQPASFEVEGDWSSASYFLALGAMSEGPGVEVANLNTSSVQGDRVILDFLRNMGAVVKPTMDSITVSKGKLKAIQADLSDCIDLLPTMAVLAALAEGKSEFIGIERARIKESNRVAAVRQELTKLGIPVVEEGNHLFITGLMTKVPSKDGESMVTRPSELSLGADITIDSHGDHRIAMAFAVLGTALGGIVVDGAECVAKTFPGFWGMLGSIGGKFQGRL